MAKLGLNIHGMYLHGREQVILDHIAATNPRAVLVMDNLPLAVSIRRAHPQTDVIYRAYVPDDVWMHQTPAQWFASQRVYAEQHDLALYVLNEPDYTPAVIDWLTECASLCVAAGVRAVVANLSVGRPEPNQWIQADKLLRLIATNPRLLSLGLHEYCPLLLHYEAGADPRHIPDFAPPRTWLLGRWRFLKDKYPNVPVVITEFGWDTIDAARQWQEPRIGAWVKHAGYQTSRVFWAANQPDDPDVYAARQVEFAMRHYYADPQVRAVMLWCAGGAEPVWSDSDATLAPRFMQALRTIDEGSEPMAPAYTIKANGSTLTRARVGGVTVNVRALPHTGAAIVDPRQLRPGDVVEYYADSDASGNGFAWRRLASGAWFAQVQGLTLEAESEARAVIEAQLAVIRDALAVIERYAPLVDV